MPRIDGGISVNPDAGSGPVYETEPLEEKVWIAGLPRLHVAVTTLTNGGQLYALLEDCDDQGSCIHLGHAIMDLRYHAGGNEQSDGWRRPLGGDHRLHGILRHGRERRRGPYDSPHAQVHR